MKADRNVLAALAAVLVTIAAAVVGGTASGRATEQGDVGTTARLGLRSFACTGGLADGTALTGTTGKPIVERPLAELLRLSVPRQEARGAFAAMVARTGGTFAMGLCAEPRNDWWFAGAGGSVAHGSKLTVVNPRPGAAVINIDVFGSNGDVPAPGLHGVTVAGRQSRTYDLAKVAPGIGDYVVHVRAVRGLVSVGGTDSFAINSGVGRHVSEWLPDQFRPARTITLAGVQRQPARADLLLGNPGEEEALVELELVGEKGPFSPKGLEKFSVPPHSVIRRDIRKAFDGQAVAVRLTSTVPIIGTVRSLRGGDQSIATAASPLHGESVVALPPTPQREVVLTGLAAGTVRVVAYGARGAVLSEQQVKVTRDVSQLVPVPKKARYLLLSTTRPVAVAGVLGAQSAGVAAFAVPPAARALRVPAVRPGF